MERRLARSAWFASAALALAACGAAAQPLAQRDLKDPGRVEAWLRQHKDSMDVQAAQAFFRQGIESKQQGRWGPALKAFGESALRRPSALTLIEYADAHVRMLGEARAQENAAAEHKQRDLASAEQIYRSALAAEKVLPELTPVQREQARRSAECLAEYLHSGSTREPCEPLRVYGVK